MPSVRFSSSRGQWVEVEVPSGTSVLRAATGAGMPIARACGANRVCGRCVVEVRRGLEVLSAEDRCELRTKTRNKLGSRARLACCARVRGDVEVTASYW